MQTKSSQIPNCLMVTAGLLIAVFASPGLAETQPGAGCTPLAAPRIAGAIDDNVRITLAGQVNPLARSEFDQGRVEDSLPLEHIILQLKRSADQDLWLQTRIDQMHNRRSPLFHKWLSPRQVGACYGVADQDIAAVSAWLQTHGFKVDSVPAGKMLILFSGTAGQVRQAFHTEIHNLNVHGERHIANLSPPQIPAALAPVVGGFRSLNNFFPKPMLSSIVSATRDPKTGKVQRVSGPYTKPLLTTPSGSYLIGPQDFFTIYDELPALNAGVTGTGVTIAVIEETDVCAGQSASPCNGNDDDATFRSQFQLPPNQPNYSFGISGYCSDPGVLTDGEEFEADLDVQWAGAVAPGATVDFVSCASTSTSFGTDLSAIYIVNSLLATSMSESYGGCEVEEGSAAAAFYTEMWEQAAAQGQTVFVSSGDQGSLVCDRTEYGTHPISVNVVASTIYDVSTGGTDFSDVYQTDGFNIEPASTWWNTAASTSANGYESALSYVPEVTWGGICSNPLFASILEENGVTTWGTTYTPEAICNYSYNNTCGTGSTECAVDVSGGSGGISIFNSIPTWQAVYGVGLSANHSSTTARNQPDVSLYASEGDVWGHALLVCESDMYSCDFSGNSGAFAAGGGTSFVAPQMNGVMALIIQNSGAPQGNANYTFYDLAAQEYGTPGNPNTSGLSACSGSGLGAGVGGGCIFQDIAGDTPSLQGGTITSDIQQPCESGSSANCYTATAGDFLGETSLSSSTFIDAYPSSQGYDLGTGLGSLNISNLVGEWNTASTGFGSTTTVSADPPSITTSGTTTLTASVATTGRGNIAPALGTVTFTDSSSGATLGTAALAVTCAGTPPAYTCSPTIATLSGVSASSLVFGSNTIVASFPGDGANDLPSSGSVTVTVTLPPATTTVTSSQNPSTQGQSVTFTATVTASGSPAPTGTVSFTSNGAAISGCSSVTLASGTALCTTTPAIGTDAIVAAYSGDSNYSGSNGTFSQLVNPLPTPVQFFSVTPCRVVDTRKADGPFGGPELTAGETRAFTIPAGPCTGIPATAAAYSLNVTVVPPGPLGYLSIWPSGEGQPVVSTLNSLDGRVKANAAIVPAGSSGAVSVYVNNTTNVVLDIDGYFAAGGGSSLEFYPLTPCRVADTRKTPDGPLAGPALVADAERDFPILSSACSIPSTALAYSLNFTVVPLATGAAVGYLTVWPQGQTKPLVSTLNDLTGTIVANAALVPAGTDGGVAAYASNATNLVIDVNGYFAPAGTGGLQLYALTPCRVLDTRKTTGNFTGELTVNVAGSTCAPSSADKAYVFNATAVPAGDLGYLTLWPDGETQPVVSTLNAEDGAITSNMAIVPNTDGSTDAYASGTTQLILDISAYFAP